MTLAPPRLPGKQADHHGSDEWSDPEALIPEARARQRRRRLGIAALLALLAAAGGGIYGGFGGGSTRPPAIPVIERNLAGALANTRTTLIMRMHKRRLTKTPQYASAIEWVDFATGRHRYLEYDASGRLKTEVAFSYAHQASPGDWYTHSLEVAPKAKTWSVETNLMQCGGDAQDRCVIPLPPYEDCICDLDPSLNYRTPPRVSLLGEQTIDGRSTFHLRYVVTGVLAATIDLWIDRSTYLPLHQKVVADQRITINDFTWLPRTKANLARVTVAVPRGFVRSVYPVNLGAD
jgi:hypothetical protein